MLSQHARFFTQETTQRKYHTSNHSLSSNKTSSTNTLFCEVMIKPYNLIVEKKGDKEEKELRASPANHYCHLGHLIIITY
jgi:hypothetical protein